ncbi:MAG TPA: T9SS type A sorting domain-containing protein [Bacteroidia bacterium]|jgi:hypothetical protein|nr:T9SS type A sorting domain-containing protein [Bacteroidia bacterium]
MKKNLFLIFLFVVVVTAAQPPRKFHTCFGGYGHDIGYGIVQTLNGQYAVTGSTSSFGYGNTDVYFALVDSMGWVRWEKSYGGFNNDIGKSIIQLSDSGYVIAGYTNSFGSGGYDVYVIRIDKNGTLIWQKTIGGLDWDFGNCVLEASNGGFIICGNTYSYGYGKSDGFLIKLDINGNFQWQKTYGGIEDDNFKSVIETYNNMFAIVGATSSYGDLNGDAWLFKTNLNGDSILNMKYGNIKTDYFNDLIERPVSNRYIMVGATDYDLRDSTYAFTIESDENGNAIGQSQWSYHNMVDAQLYSITNLKVPYSAVVRKQYNSTQGRKLEPFVMVLLNIWDFAGSVSPYGSPEDDDLFAVAKTRDKGFVCVGYTKGFTAILSDVYLVKIDSNYNNVTGGPSIVGINEPQKHANNFSIYPTVTKDEITIDADPSIKEIIIYVSDCLGNVLMKTKRKEINSTLSLGNFNEGFYFITVSEGNFSKTFKVIKSN